MEVSGPNVLTSDVEEKALKSLLDAFGSVFTLQEIASAYCNAGQNADLAGELLFDRQGSTSSSTTHSSTGVPSNKPSSVNVSENSYQAHGNMRAPKKKWRPASGGTVSCFLGKDYVKPTLAANGSSAADKPCKLDPKELPVSELWREEAKPSSKKDDCLHKDMEDFLFKMLGVGFQLNRDVIRDVLDNCGYDMQKSMLKLLDHSAMTADREGKSPEKFAEMCSNSERLHCERKLQQQSPPRGGGGDSSSNDADLCRQLEERNDLQKEIFASLFTTTEMIEESPKRRVKAVKSSKALRKPVTEPFKDFTPDPSAYTMQLHLDDINDEGEEGREGSYQALRKAVLEYRGTMKEYYKAAIDAFAKGDHVQAGKFLERGHFFHGKARKADEESHQKIFETRNVVTQTDMLLDLHEHSPKEALRLLKCHLSSLAGIPSFKDLKVIIETDVQDSSKGARRRLVTKLLEKESIEWTPEEGNAGSIVIRLDKINPSRLSFAKK